MSEGERHARVHEIATCALVCERGKAKMSLRLDRGEPARIVEFSAAPRGGAPACR